MDTRLVKAHDGLVGRYNYMVIPPTYGGYKLSTGGNAVSTVHILVKHIMSHRSYICMETLF